MNALLAALFRLFVSAGCHINDVMNNVTGGKIQINVSAGCHINDVMNAFL